MGYLDLFNNHSGYAEFTSGSTMITPNVSHCIEENHVHYNPNGYKYQYFTIEALEDGNFSLFYGNNFDYTGGTYTEYSVDNGQTWTRLTYENLPVETAPVEMHEGDRVFVRGINESLCSNWWNDGVVCCGFNFIGDTATDEKMYNVEGNIMSWLCGDDFVDRDDVVIGENCFASLFQNSKVIDASKLILPRTELTGTHCYGAMFKNCEYLEAAPILKATVLSRGCYEAMFENCVKLMKAPKLPARTLAPSCYSNMFHGCDALLAAPELPARNLEEFCYYHMFNDCTNLETAPTLPARTLAETCYAFMFYNCTKLVSVTCLATDISAPGCTGNWLGNVAQYGMFTKAAGMNDWASGGNGIPTEWSVVEA